MCRSLLKRPLFTSEYKGMCIGRDMKNNWQRKKKYEYSDIELWYSK